jgi:hypothetical protein
MIVYRAVNSMTLVAGLGSYNTPNLKGGLCYKIVATTSTDTTRFQMDIRDRDNTLLRTWNYRQGQLIDDTPLILQGINTFTVSSASANEPITIKMWLRE